MIARYRTGDRFLLRCLSCERDHTDQAQQWSNAKCNLYMTSCLHRFQSTKHKEKNEAAARLRSRIRGAQATAYGGFGERLLKQMGWEDGQGLGRDRKGRAKAIEVKAKEDTVGVRYLAMPVA